MARRRRTLAAGVSLGVSESGSEDGSAAEPAVVDEDEDVGSAAEPAVVDVDEDVGSAAEPAVVDVDEEVGSAAEPAVVDVDEEVGSAGEPVPVAVVVLLVMLVAVLVFVELGPEIDVNTSKTSGQVNDGLESYSMKRDPSPDSQKLTLLQLRAPYSPPLTTQEPVAGLSADFSKVL